MDGGAEIESCTCIDCKESCTRINFDKIEAYADEGFYINMKVDDVIFDLIGVIVALISAFILVVIVSYTCRERLLSVLIAGNITTK